MNPTESKFRLTYKYMLLTINKIFRIKMPMIMKIN